MNLKRMFGASQPQPAKFIDGRVGFAIGDVHGRADLLQAMITFLEERAQDEAREGGEPIVVFLGDYVDRGPQSATVVDMLLKGHPRGFERHYLKGNHEQSMLAFLEQPLANRAWVRHGGSETCMAYGIQPPPSLNPTDEDWTNCAEQLKRRIPPTHLEFLNRLERYAVFGDYAFVHAGVDAAKSLENQTDTDLFWSRLKFLNNKRRFSHRVVHGHTPAERPYIDDRRIGVDTGAYASGTLTAARFEGEEVSFFAVSERAVRRQAATQKSV